MTSEENISRRHELRSQELRATNIDGVSSALEMARRMPSVDAKTAALLVGVSQDSMIRAAKQGKFGAFLVVKRYRFPSRRILDVIEGHGAGIAA